MLPRVVLADPARQNVELCGSLIALFFGAVLTWAGAERLHINLTTRLAKETP